MFKFFFPPLLFSTAEVSDSWTVLLGSLQAMDETSWPFLSRWLWHCKGAGQVQARAPERGAGRWLGSGGGAAASARSWLQRGNFPSTLVKWVQSWSRRLAAKACKAAWVNRAVHRLMRAHATECWKRRGACYDYRWCVLQLGTAKFIQLIFENLTCIAGNCFDVLWVRRLALIGTSHGVQYFMHGTDRVINNWNTIVSKCGQRNIYPNIGTLQITLLYLMTIGGQNASRIGT